MREDKVLSKIEENERGVERGLTLNSRRDEKKVNRASILISKKHVIVWDTPSIAYMPILSLIQ
jgi:hypothetical protein